MCVCVCYNIYVIIIYVINCITLISCETQSNKELDLELDFVCSETADACDAVPSDRTV